jgi:adenylate cyclase
MNSVTLIVHLREKLQMQKFVSKLTVQMIRKGASELSPVGERRQVTLLFSDVRSFSSLTERLSAEEIVRLINIYLDLQARIVEENNGIVDKFMGDQIMALFVDDDQTDTAVHAAVEIQRSIHELNDRRRRVGEMVLNVGCGLNSGSAVMGNMGSANRLDYTVIGDVVNLASRLCAIARPGQIIVPREMISELKNEYATIDLDSVHVKGRSQMMDICEIDYDHAIIM